MDNRATASSTATHRNDRSGMPFQIRGSMQTMLCLRVLDPDHPAFFDDLVAKVAHNPDFFRNAPMVIDVGALASAAPGNLAMLIEGLRAQRLAPVGLQNGSAAWNEEAARLGLAVFAAGNEPRQPPPRRQQAEQPKQAVERVASVVTDQPVRGGQQVMSQGDLVVLSTVSPGAEIAAVGHVHVYGSLRGRVFAGIEGDANAMIFCDSLDAELVSIAGIHAVNEDIDARLLKKRVRVSCEGEQLRFQPIP
ncbi:MAG: septum site-determining protein MinC [Geminicoccaceae bacterium]|nr:septum site-determining protein MinC [Geminicoccaceae bacterium]